MKVIWLGHASFMIVSSRGSRIVIDPYSNIKVKRKFPEVEADIVLLTHLHPDHNASWQVKGSPVVIKHTTPHIGEYEVTVKRAKEVFTISAFPTHHDSSGGKRFGPNTIFTFVVDGIKLCHCGDLGHLLSPADAREIGSCDILFCPIGGGGYTLDKHQMLKLMDQLKAIVVFPMHFKTSFTPWISDTIDDIDTLFPSVEHPEKFYFTFITLPHLPKIIALSEKLWEKIPDKINPDELT